VAAAVVQAPRLQAMVQAIVAAGGSEAREAELVASNLVEANLSGHDSHGVGMMPLYVMALQNGGLKANQRLRVDADMGAILKIDGRRGYGQVTGFEAMNLGIARALSQGACVMGLYDTHHLGRIGHWAEQCARAGLVSIHFVNVLSRPIVAPFGGREPRYSTNPVCIGVPRPGRPPFLLDFATSRVASGKVRVAHNKGEQLAPGMLIDHAGKPTTEPAAVMVPPLGAILPFGEHKGYGLAIACELLAGALTGGSTWRGAGGPLRQVVNNMLSIIINPERLGGSERLGAESDALIDWVLAAQPAPGVDKVRIAGEPEQASRQRRAKEGIPVDETTWQELLACGAKVGVDENTLRRLAGV